MTGRLSDGAGHGHGNLDRSNLFASHLSFPCGKIPQEGSNFEQIDLSLMVSTVTTICNAVLVPYKIPNV